MTVPDVMGAVAAQVKAQLDPVIDGVQVEPGIVSNPTPPCVDIYPGDPFLEPTSFGPGGSVEAVFVVRARVSTADQQDGQELLLQMMDPHGPLSLWAALLADPGFGGTVDDSTVDNVSGFHLHESAGGTGGGYTGVLLGAEWRLRVELSANGAGGIPPSPPSAPTLTAAAAGDSQVTLTWTAPGSTGGAPVTGYKILRGTAAGAETPLATVSVVLGYIDTSVVNGTTYFYKVRAVNTAGDGALSNELSATPEAAAGVAFDDFNRANGPLGPGWSGPIESTGNTQPVISGSQAKVGATAQSDAYWNADSFGADQYARFTVAVTDTVASAVFLRLCITSVAVGAPTSYIANVAFTGAGAGATFTVYRGVAGSYTSLGAASGTLAGGDQVEARVVGSTVEMRKNGVVVLTVTDPAPLGPGYAGFGMSSANARVDDFEAGDL